MKKIIIGIIIGFISFPTITLGGTFIASLISGKSTKDAVQILVGQVDSLIGRVGTLEKNEACNFTDTALSTAQMQGGTIGSYKNFDELISQIILERDGEQDNIKRTPPDEKTKLMWQSRLEKVQLLKERYLIAKSKCDDVRTAIIEEETIGE
jgi:hypothetical protein